MFDKIIGHASFPLQIGSVLHAMILNFKTTQFVLYMKVVQEEYKLFQIN